MVELLDAQRWMLPQLEALEESCFSMPWTFEQLESQLPDAQHCFLTALEEGQVLGYAGMMHVLDEGYISNVAVAPPARRRGIADQLMTELMHRAHALSLAFVTLEVRVGNAPAIALYEKHGFQPVGLRRGYYDCPKEDALLMTNFIK